jgi:hypothetical protein
LLLLVLLKLSECRVRGGWTLMTAMPMDLLLLAVKLAGFEEKFVCEVDAVVAVALVAVCDDAHFGRTSDGEVPSKCVGDIAAADTHDVAGVVGGDANSTDGDKAATATRWRVALLQVSGGGGGGGGGSGVCASPNTFPAPVSRGSARATRRSRLAPRLVQTLHESAMATANSFFSLLFECAKGPVQKKEKKHSQNAHS